MSHSSSFRSALPDKLCHNTSPLLMNLPFSNNDNNQLCAILGWAAQKFIYGIPEFGDEKSPKAPVRLMLHGKQLQSEKLKIGFENKSAFEVFKVFEL